MQTGALIEQIAVVSCHIGQEARFSAPISWRARNAHRASVFRQSWPFGTRSCPTPVSQHMSRKNAYQCTILPNDSGKNLESDESLSPRSEERRVGKECRS